MSLGRIFKSEAWAEARSQMVHAALQFLLPLSAAAMTFISGFVGGSPAVPWPYLLTATGLTFMAAIVGAFFSRLFFYQQNPDGKFYVHSPGLAKRYGIVKDQTKLVGLKYQFNYQNTAIFPIRFDVKPLHVSLGTTFNPNPQRGVTGSTSLGGAAGVFQEAEIPVTESMNGQTVEGQWEFEIGYGKPNRRQHSIIQKWKTYVKFDTDGDVEGFQATDVS